MADDTIAFLASERFGTPARLVFVRNAFIKAPWSTERFDILRP